MVFELYLNKAVRNKTSTQHHHWAAKGPPKTQGDECIEQLGKKAEEGGHQDDVTAEGILPPKYLMLGIRLALVEVLAVFITCVSVFLINRQVQIRRLLGVLY